jgi:hypothetical protein
MGCDEEFCKLCSSKLAEAQMDLGEAGFPFAPLSRDHHLTGGSSAATHTSLTFLRCE